MKTYMATYTKQNYFSGEWLDDEQSQNTLFIFAENEEESQERLEMALKKLNQHAHKNVRYIKQTEPREIMAMSVSHNLARSTTSINGIWE